MTDGIEGKDPEFSTTFFPPRPLKSNTHREFDREHLSAVYLLSDERMEMLMNNGAILYSGIGSEVEVLSRLIRDDVDYGFVKQIDVPEMGHILLPRQILSLLIDISFLMSASMKTTYTLYYQRSAAG